MNFLKKIIKQWEGCDICGKWCWGKCSQGSDFPE